LEKIDPKYGLSDALMGAHDGTVPNGSDQTQQKNPAVDHSSAVIRVAGVVIPARGKSITSRRRKIVVTVELEATPIGHDTPPLRSPPSCHLCARRVSEPFHGTAVIPYCRPIIADEPATARNTYSPRRFLPHLRPPARLGQIDRHRPRSL
jgi:hypothetical protein